MDTDFDELAEITGWNQGGEESFTEHLEQIRETLRDYLGRAGEDDSLEYLVIQACNKIYHGGIPLGICKVHGPGKLHARISSCGEQWEQAAAANV